MATLTVGKNQEYTTIAAAIAATHDGDTVLIQAGTYLNDFATIYHKITLQSVGGLAVLQATAAPPNGKAILTTETDVTINGLGFTGAFCADSNGAGIRYEGGNLVVRNSVFWTNQDGILGNADPNGTVLIQASEFSHNGAGDGYSHGIYINAVKSLTVQDSYFHDVLAGHEIKSRALATTITGSRILDNTQGTGSYSIDVPDGGAVTIANNIIEKGANTANQFTIHFGGEHTPPAGSSLSVTGNTIVNDRSNGTLLLNQSGIVATLTGNALYGFAPDRIANGPATVSGSIVLTTRPVLNLGSQAPTVLPPPAVPPPVDHSTGTTLQNWGTGGAVLASGRILTVGATGTFRTLESALAVSRDGDTIEVAAGTYVNDFADINHKVIIEGVGGIAHFVQINDLSRQRGIFVANTDATIRNVELSGATNYNGHEAGLYVAAGNVTLVNSKVDRNDVGVGAGDNAASNLAIYNADIGDNFNTAKGTHNITVGAINSLTVQGSYLHGAISGHELSDQAYNSDIENDRIIDGANVNASFLIDLGAGGAATIKNNLLVKGAQAANGILVHVGGEAMTDSNSNVQVTGNTMVTQYSNPGHPYTYFVVGDPNKPLAPITASGNTFVGGIAGSRWLTNASDGGGNGNGTAPTINTASPVTGALAPALFAPQSGPDTLKLILAEHRGDLDAKFVVAVDGVGAGGGVVTAPYGSATQTFSFTGTWAPGAHQVAVTIINSQTGDGGGAYALDVASVSLDNSIVTPNVSLNRATYTATLTASAPSQTSLAPAKPAAPATLVGFDAAWYLAHNPDVAAAHVDPLQHYLTYGWREGRDPGAFFDTTWYLAHNPDVKASGMNPLLHYDLFGWREGRDPSALFSSRAYLAANPDVAAAGVNPLQEYLDQGRAEGRPSFIAGTMASADPLVDPAYLNKQLGDTLLPTGPAAAKQVHWVFDTADWQKGLNPNAWFNTNYYLAHNPDVAAAHTDPLTHFETFGWKEGRDPSAGFSTSKYLAAYADVKAAGMDPLLHWVVFGQSEGRKAFAV